MVNSSRRQALARSAIHTLPSAVSLILVTIQINGYFIGGTLRGSPSEDEFKFGLLQMVAKVQVMSRAFILTF